MKFIITTCVFSQSNKPRPAAHVDTFLKSNEILTLCSKCHQNCKSTKAFRNYGLGSLLDF